MKILDVKQGSPEWLQARLGIPTASQFGRIITAKTMKVSDSSQGYLCKLLAERMLGCEVSEASSGFMERGTALEKQAVAYYELRAELDTKIAGFCIDDACRYGCSPDRLVGDDGGLELKCPSAAVHVAYLLDGPEGVSSKYRPQIQGCMWVTGRRWWDVLSYHPEMPSALFRVPRDEEYCVALELAVVAFVERLEQSEARLRDAGLWADPLREAG